MKYPSEIDVPVLIIFFTRSSTLQKVFDSIKKARPSTLLLWQDGPRNEKDTKGIDDCRRIFDDIDWECTVYSKYNTENMGCDPSTFRAQKWAFSIVDKCIVLEDDMVPSQSYYTYCKELLDLYEYDDRVGMICGVNHLEESKFLPADYTFAYYGSGAWASWRRVADTWDSEYSFLDKEYYLNNLKRKMPILYPVAYRIALRRRSTGFEWWETIIGFSNYLNNRLVIIPKVNLVSNIGVTEEATHGSSLRMMSKRVRKLFFAEAKELTFPLNHPDYVVPDYMYMDEISMINCLGHPWLKCWENIVYYFKLIWYGELWKTIKKVIAKHKRNERV